MKSQFLPVGSVVTLKGAQKKLTVIGSSVKRNEDDKIYDYIGLPYPEGYIDSETMFLFMAEDIEEINFLGYINAEAQAFHVKYEEHLKENGLIKDEE